MGGLEKPPGYRLQPACANCKHSVEWAVDPYAEQETFYCRKIGDASLWEHVNNVHCYSSPFHHEAFVRWHNGNADAEVCASSICDLYEGLSWED